MTTITTTRPTTPPPDGAARPRGPRQWLLAALTLIYLALGWHYAGALLMLIEIEAVAPRVGLLSVTGTVFLVLGAARSLYQRHKGRYCLLLAAAELALAAPQIGNWDYRVSKVLLATLVFGMALALLGAWWTRRNSQP
jgi:membrane-bound ClpP family serine protease